MLDVKSAFVFDCVRVCSPICALAEHEEQYLGSLSTCWHSKQPLHRVWGGVAPATKAKAVQFELIRPQEWLDVAGGVGASPSPGEEHASTFLPFEV